MQRISQFANKGVEELEPEKYPIAVTICYPMSFVIKKLYIVIV